MVWQGSPEILEVLTVIQGYAWLAGQRLQGPVHRGGAAGHYLERLCEGAQRLAELVTPFAQDLGSLPRTVEIDALLILLDYYAESAQTLLSRDLDGEAPALRPLATVRTACARLRALLPPCGRPGF